MIAKKGVVTLTNEDKILEILTGMQNQMNGMQQEIKQINGRLDTMDGRLGSLEAEVKEIHQKVDDLTESHEETRASVNALLDWAERASNSYDLPLPKLG